jgi:hypothetical protein
VEVSGLNPDEVTKGIRFIKDEPDFSFTIELEVYFRGRGNEKSVAAAKR